MFIKSNWIVLIDPNFLSLFLKLTLPKVNVYDLRELRSKHFDRFFLFLTLIECLEQMDMWFSKFVEQSNLLPPHPLFDYDFFFTVLRTMLTSEHHVVVSYALIFVCP